MEEGLYMDGRSADPIKCGLSLSGEVLNIFPKDGELVVWNVRNLATCYFNGSTLHLTYGRGPHQALECRGAIARQIHDVWSGNNVIRKTEGLMARRTYTAVTLICALFLGAALLVYFYMLPW